MVKARHRGPLEQASGRAVRDYLDGLRSGQRSATHHPSRDAALRRLDEIEAELATAPPIRELKLVQERHELRRVVDRGQQADQQALEDAFVDVAGAYSRRHGISYATWREVGVSASVLHRAGIRPSGRRKV